MGDYPERIYADHGPRGGLIYREQRMPDTVAEYVRSDLHAPLVAEVERLRRELYLARNERDNLADNIHRAETDARALASTAVKEKAKPRLTDAAIRAACKAHFGSELIDGVNVTAHDVDWSFRDAFKRMWHGAWSALTTEPAAPQEPTVLQHTEMVWTGEGPYGVAAAPQEAEAVAGYLFRLRYGPDRWSNQDMFSECLPSNPDDVKDVRPLFFSPPAQAVTEASTAARFNRLHGIVSRILWTNVGVPALENDQTKSALDDLSEYLFAAALTAAQEAGR